MARTRTHDIGREAQRLNDEFLVRLDRVEATLEPIDALFVEPCRLHLHIQQSNGHAIILIEDSGRGIPAAELLRVFEAFYTTKGELGTGIGLWVTKELVEKNGGEISVESGDLIGGMSTRFRLQFPC